MEMEEFLAPVRRRTFVILAVAILAVAPWLGFWPLLFLIPAGAFFAVADHHLQRAERPEYVMFAAWIGSELSIAGAVWLEGGAKVAALCWLAIPVITLSSRFSMRGVVAGVAVAVALALGVGFGANAQAVIASPELLIAAVALILCVAVLSTPLMHSDIRHRSDAVIDQLTGMLNRKALSTRVVELAQQSELTGEPVGLIVADLDHFKRINDTLGHVVGDSVLKEVAYLLRKQLRAFDLAYRLGGEEFLILVPGSDVAGTLALAEGLRRAICAQEIAGIEVTMSFGVHASSRGSRFDYDAVFATADAALYAAKRAGRNRVCTEDGGPIHLQLASAARVTVPTQASPRPNNAAAPAAALIPDPLRS